MKKIQNIKNSDEKKLTQEKTQMTGEKNLDDKIFRPKTLRWITINSIKNSDEENSDELKRENLRLENLRWLKNQIRKNSDD